MKCLISCGDRLCLQHTFELQINLFSEMALAILHGGQPCRWMIRCIEERRMQEGVGVSRLLGDFPIGYCGCQTSRRHVLPGSLAIERPFCRSRTELQRLEPISGLVSFIKNKPLPTFRGRCNKICGPGILSKGNGRYLPNNVPM